MKCSDCRCITCTTDMYTKTHICLRNASVRAQCAYIHRSMLTCTPMHTCTCTRARTHTHLSLPFLPDSSLICPGEGCFLVDFTSLKEETAFIQEPNRWNSLRSGVGMEGGGSRRVPQNLASLCPEAQSSESSGLCLGKFSE